MTENHQSPNKRNTGRLNDRPTIGFLTRNLGDVMQPIESAMWRGIADVARERDVNLICYAGGVLRSVRRGEAQANVLYDLVNTEILDGLIVWGSVLSWDVGEAVRDLYERYRPLPMVSIGLSLAGIPSLLVDNYQGIHDVVAHLIAVHDCRRIAFVRGAEGHRESEERYQAYVDTLADYGIPLDLDLVFEAGLDRLGMQAVIDQVLHEGEANFDAVVGHNDNTAIGVLESLFARGVRVPDDVIVAGFGDIPEARIVSPPLTTARYAFYDYGRQSAEMLLTVLAGEIVSEEVLLSGNLIVRQSCGCIDPVVEQAAVESVTEETREDFSSHALGTTLRARREDIISKMVLAVVENSPNPRNVPDSDWARSLYEALSDELNFESSGVFMRALDAVLRRVMTASHTPATLQTATGQEVAAWQAAISALRRYVLPYLGGEETRSRAESLWRQARVVIGETAQRIEAYHALQIEQETRMLRELGQALITTFDVQELMDILARELPRLGIPRCYLSLYENTDKPAESARLILAYDEGGRVEVRTGGQVFPSTQLVPAGMLPRKKQYSLAVEPLYFREEQLGFVLFEEGPAMGMIYGVLRGQISSALQGALLVERRRRAEVAIAKRATELELVTQVSVAASTILDTTELLQQVADLTKERFGLYHAHIYLVDEVEETLALVAGAGTVGRQMVAEGWSIPLRRGQSLVTRAARTRQGVIVNDVKADPGWLPNRLLPDTCSELAVPLLVGERVLGVLDVQAAEVDHFTEDDIRIQTALATQVTVALENARLFQQGQENLAFIEKLYQAGRRIAAATDLQEIVAAMAEASPGKDIDRVVLLEFEYDVRNRLEGMVVRANWYSGQGMPPTPVGTRYQQRIFPGIDAFLVSEPVVFGDIERDERFEEEMQALFRRLRIRTMAALPLWAGARRTGVLLLQSEAVYQLSEEEVQPFVSLLGQVAVAVENQRLLAEMNVALAEVEATQHRYVVQPWEAYQTRQVAQGYEQVREGISLTDSELSATQLPAATGRQQLSAGEQPAMVRAEQSEAPSNLVVPLTVRDEVIGLLGLQEMSERAWTPDEVALVEAVAEQLAQAYQNLRLIDETQQRAAREGRISKIGERVREAQSLEEALQIAIREVGQSLDVSQAMVKLGISDT